MQVLYIQDFLERKWDQKVKKKKKERKWDLPIGFNAAFALSCLVIIEILYILL